MEWFLDRNVAEAGEDGCGIVDKWSGSVEEMERLCGGNGRSSVEDIRSSVEGDGAVRA